MYCLDEYSRRQTHAHHMGRDLFCLGRRGSRSWVKLVDEEAWEFILPNQIHSQLEILVGLSRKSTDDIGGDGDARDPVEKPQPINQIHKVAVIRKVPEIIDDEETKDEEIQLYGELDEGVGICMYL